MDHTFSYDELYGVSLTEYYDYLDKHIEWTTASDVIPQIVKCEIEMLEHNYKENFAKRNIELNEYEQQLAIAIQKLLDKKRKHLKRLLNWKQ